jgi:hypothetical protein
MRFSKFINRGALVLCAIAVSLSVAAPSVSAASIPTLGTKLYYILGSVMFGGMVHQGTQPGDTTSVAGYWQTLPEFASATTLRPITNSITSVYPYKGNFTAYIRASTGSTTLRYNGTCFPNPLKKITGGGSGSIVSLEYQNKYNPTGVGGDIGFVKDCTKHGVGDSTASGDTVINNACTVTGCTLSMTGTMLNFNNADYIKFTPRAALAGGFIGRITFTLLNNIGK